MTSRSFEDRLREALDYRRQRQLIAIEEGWGKPPGSWTAWLGGIERYLRARPEEIDMLLAEKEVARRGTITRGANNAARLAREKLQALNERLYGPWDQGCEGGCPDWRCCLNPEPGIHERQELAAARSRLILRHPWLADD